jgi:hypothetical protein
MEQIAPEPTVVVEQESSPKLAEPAAKRPKTGPKWETEARERLRTAIKRLQRPLQELVQRDANEGDTRMFITDFLTEAFGFDKYADLTTEYRVKGEFADYGIRIEKQLVAFLEAKRATTKLGAKHLRQVEMYAVNEGVEWLILTNGPHWQVYHLTGGLPVVIDLAIDVDLLGEETVTQRANQLFYITKESLRRRQIDELWKSKVATGPQSLGQALVSPVVLTAIRKELRRRTDHNVDEREIERLLRESVLRPECFEGARRASNPL